MQGEEVAVAVQGPTVGRHIEELDEFYVDVPERHVKRLKKLTSRRSRKKSSMKSWPCIERTITSGDVKPRNVVKYR